MKNLIYYTTLKYNLSVSQNNLTKNILNKPKFYPTHVNYILNYLEY